ncbi:MAG: ABC transporter permease [Lachnospiraceae bacterium]|nr:ABC transporter permease [Lachnospiraceae bacterium]
MIQKDIKILLTEKKMLIVLIVLIAIGIVGAVFAKPSQSSINVRFGVYDADDSQYSQMLISYFRENESFSSYITLVEKTLPELEQMLADGEIDLYLVIPEDFAAKLMRMDNVPIRAVVDSSDKTKAVLYKNLLLSYAQYISSVQVNAQAVYDIMSYEGYSSDKVSSVNYSLSYDLIFTALGKDAFFKHIELERIEGVSLVNYYVSSGIVLAVMYAGLMAGLLFLTERKSLASDRLRCAGKGIVSQFMSKITAFFILCGLAFGILILILNLTEKMNFSAASVFMVFAGILISCALFMLISCFMDSAQGYSIFANMIILLLTIVGGGIIPVMYLPEAVAKVARFTPNYWFIRTLL